MHKDLYGLIQFGIPHIKSQDKITKAHTKLVEISVEVSVVLFATNKIGEACGLFRERKDPRI